MHEVFDVLYILVGVLILRALFEFLGDAGRLLRGVTSHQDSKATTIRLRRSDRHPSRTLA